MDTIGGLYTEAPPEKLPNGASPLCLNTDYLVGQAIQRPGEFSAFYFLGFFEIARTRFAENLPGPDYPNEVAWSNPINATKGITGQYASATLNPGIPVGVPFVVTATQQTLPEVNTNWAACLALFNTTGTPVVLQQQKFTHGTPLAFPNPMTAGTSIVFLCIGHNLFTGAPFSVFVSDSLTNLYGLVQAVQNPGTGDNVGQPQVDIFLASNPNAGTNTLTYTTSGVVVSTGYAFEVTNLAGLNVSAGNTIGDSGTISVSATPTASNTWPVLGAIPYPTSGPDGVQSVTGGVLNFTDPFGTGGGNFDTDTWISNLTTAFAQSEYLNTLNFAFNITGETSVLGFQVIIDGFQTTEESACILSATAIDQNGNVGETFTGQLPSTPGALTLGTPISDWGLNPTPDGFDNPNFTVRVRATALDGTPVTFNISSVQIEAWLVPVPAPNFNYLKTFAETGGEVLNLALGSDGVIYQEDVINAPGALSVVYSNIQPNSFAQSATQDDREFIAISNLLNGTDIPYTYTPPNFDRLSQVGPGATPSASTTSAAANVLSITQNPPVEIPTSTGGTTGSFIVWSASPQDTGTFGNPQTPGNVMTWVFPSSFVLPSYLAVGSNIVISGVQEMNGYNPNNGVGNNPAYYTISAIGGPIPGQEYYDGFSIILPQTGFYNLRFQAGSAFQATIATMTTAKQVPNLEVNDQFQLSGTGGAPPAGYDSSWTVLTTPNASQLEITSTSLTNNIATYGYNLISGTNPVLGQTITVTLTLNGDGIFNVSQAVITAASPGSFSINLVSPNIMDAAETGSGIVFGTIFTFDAFTIVGNKTGGDIVTIGTIAAGIRKVCYSFLTRNGFITQPSPILTFNVVAGASGIAIGNLLTGPDNVIARIIHLTAADGGNFYNIPAPVSVIDNGTTVINSSTWVLDNTTTNVILSFSDAVLLAADEIDIQGNNLFECSELGSCVAIIPYSNRLAVVGEQNKIFNLLNYSFDGGIGLVQGNTGGGGGAATSRTYPAGWVVDPTNGGGGSVITSPIFGFAYQISNTTGSTQATYGMITQPAYQDEFQVPIIAASTTYSVRATVSVPTGASGGNLVIDLFSPSFGRALGTFTQPLASIGASMQIFTGTLLTTELAPVPTDLVIRIYATNIPNGVIVQMDRMEPFPTETPNLNTQVILSYNGNFESFDRVTGVVLGTNQNQQPIVSGFVLFDSLYLSKSGSHISVNDNNTTEPSGWANPRTISQSVGAAGVNAVTTGIDEPNSGEDYALVACQPGLFMFYGGQAIKLSEEIQSLWNQINWKYGYTIWVKNDITNRRILVGVPLQAQISVGGNLVSPAWLPAGTLSQGQNPTTPNVILELNYKQLNTSQALADSPEVHRSYSGKLLASEITRKWSIWTIQAPCAAFLERPDTTNQIFLGNSVNNGKIYQLIDGLMEDDGAAIHQVYTTYGFVPSEEGQGNQVGMTRYVFEYMSLLLDGSGTCDINVLPNTLDSPYAHTLIPDLTLPASTNGDVEVPVNESGSRLFVQFDSNEVGAEFILSRVVMAMRQDPWAPVRGVNT